MLLLKISDNCHENTSAKTTFWKKIGLSCSPTTTFIKMDTLAQVFSSECWERNIYKNTFTNKQMKNLARGVSEAAVHRFSLK